MAYHPELWHGARFNSRLEIGAPTVITFGFTESLPYDFMVRAKDYKPLQDQVRDAFRMAFQAWDEAAPGVVFKELHGEDAMHAAIRVSSYSTRAAIPPNVVNDAEAFMPDAMGGHAGDIWINHTSPKFGSVTPGTQGYGIIVHEIGHALGLVHPQTLSGADTVMTYNWGANPTGPRALDIEAIKHIYGDGTANRAHLLVNSSDTGIPSRVIGSDLGEIYIHHGGHTAQIHVNMGGGLDMFVDTQNSTNWTINVQGGTVTLTQGKAGTTGYSTRTFEQTERIAFTNQTLALDIEGNAGQSYRLYQAAFDRTPDKVGLGHWINQMDSGMSLLDVAARFVASDEFRSVYGAAPQASDYVNRLYENILGRKPEPTGAAFWVGELTSGKRDMAKVLADVSESAENKQGTLTQTADGIWY